MRMWADVDQDWRAGGRVIRVGGILSGTPPFIDEINARFRVGVLFLRVEGLSFVA